MDKIHLSRCSEIITVLSNVLKQRDLIKEAKTLTLLGASFCTKLDQTSYQEVFKYLKKLSATQYGNIGKLAFKAFCALPSWKEEDYNENLFRDFVSSAKKEMN